MKDQREIIIPDLDYQAEVRKCKTMEDVVGKNGLMQKLFKDIIQQLLEAEMEEHLGRERHERSNEANPNYRNGYSSKTIESSFGEVGLDIPRDRKAQFEPKVVKKYETVCNELDKKIIGLYACGMSVRDIQSEMEELYGIDVSPAMISKITDKVVEAAAEWQSRELDEIYPIVYMDAMHFKVRDDNKIVSKAAYICMALDLGKTSIVIAMIFAIISTWGSYYYSDRIVLSLNKARPATKEENQKLQKKVNEYLKELLITRHRSYHRPLLRL